MPIRPLNDRVIIRRLDAETISRGGIVIPENAKQQPNKGIVVAVGSGRLLENGEREPIEFKPNDTVIFAKYQAEEVTIEDEKLLVVRVHDVQAVLETD